MWDIVVSYLHNKNKSKLEMFDITDANISPSFFLILSMVLQKQSKV